MFLFPFVFLAAILFTTMLKSSQKKDASSLDAFWEREVQANSAPQKDIDNLNYITISLNALPFLSNPSKNIEEYEKAIKTLSERRILNLNGITNTELKLQYGITNLPRLSEYDENYNVMQRILSKWGVELKNEGYKDEAVKVLEYALELGCDAKIIYMTLRDLYHELGINRIEMLKSQVSAGSALTKEFILRELNQPYTPPCTDYSGSTHHSADSVQDR